MDPVTVAALAGLGADGSQEPATSQEWSAEDFWPLAASSMANAAELAGLPPLSPTAASAAAAALSGRVVGQGLTLGRLDHLAAGGNGGGQQQQQQQQQQHKPPQPQQAQAQAQLLQQQQQEAAAQQQRLLLQQMQMQRAAAAAAANPLLSQNQAQQLFPSAHTPQPAAAHDAHHPHGTTGNGVASSASSVASTSSPRGPGLDGKRRGSDTARKDRSNILKAYLMNVGCTKIRGARKRRKNEEGAFEGGKVDWDSEWVQEQLVVPLQEFQAIRLDYERRSKEKKLTDATIERDWVTKGDVRIPKAKMLKNYYPTNLILHRFFDKIHGKVLKDKTAAPRIEEQMQGINPFVKTRPLALLYRPDGGAPTLYRGVASRTDPLVVSYHALAEGGQEVLEVDGRFAWGEQRAVLSKGPSLTPINYLDDLWAMGKGVCSRLRPSVEIPALWLSAFGHHKASPTPCPPIPIPIPIPPAPPAMGEGPMPTEMGVDLFLSCFSEELRPALRYLLCAPYEHKATVSMEEFQALFAWVAGLVEKLSSSPQAARAARAASVPSVQEQLTALVSALEAHARLPNEGQGEGRGKLALYLTTHAAQRLVKPGDYYLRASHTQPGWIAVEYLPPSLITAHDASSLLPEPSGPQLHTQPHTSLFYFHLEQPSPSSTPTTDTPAPAPPKLLFTSQQGTHASLAALILKQTGADSWARLHQRAALRLPLPPPPPTPVATPATGGSVKRQAGGQEVLADGAGMVLNSPATRRRKEKQQQQPKAVTAAAMKGGVESLMPTPTLVAAASSSSNAGAGGQQQQQAVSGPSHRRGVGNGGKYGSHDSFGLPPGLSSLDFAHSFGGNGPSLSFHLEHPPLSSMQLYQPQQAPPQPMQLQEQEPVAMAFKADGGMMGMGVTGAGGGGSHHALVPSLDDSFPLQDFLVSSTSSFGSLGLSSLVQAPTPSSNDNDAPRQFFVDPQLLCGVSHLHMDPEQGQGQGQGQGQSKRAGMGGQEQGYVYQGF